jgi:galactokinase
VKRVGVLFREDGLGLRDEYCISGPELETMCDIARTVPGVHGERMLGGGDKGAVGAIVAADAVQNLKDAVALAYPRSRPDYKDRSVHIIYNSKRLFFFSFAVHVVKPCDGLKVIDGLLLL